MKWLKVKGCFAFQSGIQLVELQTHESKSSSNLVFGHYSNLHSETPNQLPALTVSSSHFL